MVSAGIFAMEAAVTAYIYSASIGTHFSFVAATDAFAPFWLELGAGLIALGLSIYVLGVAQRRLRTRLLARWTDPDASRFTAPPEATGAGLHGRWTSVAAMAAFGVVFFAESASLVLALLVSATRGFSVSISTNGFGEFGIEYGLVLAGVVLAFYVLRQSIAPLASAFGHQRLAATAAEVGPSIGLGESPGLGAAHDPLGPPAPSLGVPYGRLVCPVPVPRPGMADSVRWGALQTCIGVPAAVVNPVRLGGGAREGGPSHLSHPPEAGPFGWEGMHLPLVKSEGPRPRCRQVARDVKSATSYLDHARSVRGGGFRPGPGGRVGMLRVGDPSLDRRVR